jgi:hypothetical protein
MLRAMERFDDTGQMTPSRFRSRGNPWHDSGGGASSSLKEERRDLG